VRFALTAGLLVLAGCAPHFDIGGGEWTRPGSPVQQITLDEMECARTASRAYWTPDLIVGGLADVVRVKTEDGQMVSAFDSCMRSKGYQPARS
jgi:hypothetical protein